MMLIEKMKKSAEQERRDKRQHTPEKVKMEYILRN